MKRAFWAFITFWFVLSMHAQWAHGAELPKVPVLFTNQVIAPSLDSEGSVCGPVDTWSCWGDCRMAGPYAAGANILAVLVDVDCHMDGSGVSKTCGCHWQPVGIGLGGVGVPFRANPCPLCGGLQ